MISKKRVKSDEAGGGRQEAGGRRQEAGGRRQEAGGRRQEAGVEEGGGREGGGHEVFFFFFFFFLFFSILLLLLLLLLLLRLTSNVNPLLLPQLLTSSFCQSKNLYSSKKQKNKQTTKSTTSFPSSLIRVPSLARAPRIRVPNATKEVLVLQIRGNHAG